MQGTQHPTLMRFKETNTRCSILIPPSPMIHSGAGPLSTRGLSYKVSTTRAREKLSCTYDKLFNLGTHFPYKILDLERVVSHVDLYRPM
jgi:hypothetical protein